MPYPAIQNVALFCEDGKTLVAFTSALKRTADHGITGDVRRDRIIDMLIKDDLIRAEDREELRNKTLNELNQWLDQQMLQAVVYGDEDRAKAFLQKNPKALSYAEATAVDYSGRTIQGLTPFQAAICAGDVHMCKMMEPFFDKLADPKRTGSGKALMQQQAQDLLQKLGVDSLEALEQKQQREVFDYSGIINAIGRASDDDVQLALDLETDENQYNDPSIYRAIKKFRQDFDAKSNGEIAFNPQHLLKAFQKHDNYCIKWSYNEKK